MRSDSMRKIILVLVLLPLLNAGAQQIASSRIIAMGGLATAVSTDIDAIGTNPANLLSLSRGRVVVALAPISINAGSDFMTLKLYNDYFTGTGQNDSTGKPIGRFLTDADKQNILNAFPNGVGSIRTNINLRAFALAIRGNDIGLGFSIDDKVGTVTGLPNSFVLFALNGNPPSSTISWNNISSDTWWYRNYNADFAMKLPDILVVPKDIARNFTAGIGLKFVTGFSYTSVRTVDSYIHTDSADYSYTVNMGFTGVRAGLLSNVISKGAKSQVGDTTVNFNPFSPAGTGLGIDLGLNATVLNFIQVGLSITDIGSLNWTKNVMTTDADTQIVFSGFAPPQSDLNGSSSNLDSLKNGLNNVLKNRDVAAGSFSTSLPTRLNFGASVQLDELVPEIPGQLQVGIDYHQGFNNIYNNSTKPEFVIGAEWRPVGFFPIRTGLAEGGTYGFRWSLGFGLNFPFWDIDLGVGTFNTIADPVVAKNVIAAVSILKFRF